MDLFNYRRRPTIAVQVGNITIGGDAPIRLQSMTNTDTMQIEACVSQAQRIIEAGGELVRLTTQGCREAENLQNINDELKRLGYSTPLVADVHFNANVADVAARHTAKVRINPGNYVDASKTFRELEYTDEEYATEIERIRTRLVPFLNICKEHGTAIRLGVNHGSLSDRIMSRYGDTPEGMVESCLEFLRICVAEKFFHIVISIKASNTVVMVRTVRLMVEAMNREGMSFPLHLGVTEAGDGEDGRIKSALGIGALLSDGIGETIRVSLSEAPEHEIPVAKQLVAYINARAGHAPIYEEVAADFSYLEPTRRVTRTVKNIGGENVPVVVSNRTGGEVGVHTQFKPDYMYCGAKLPDFVRKDTSYILDFIAWKGEANTYPLFHAEEYKELIACRSEVKFLRLTYEELTEEIIALLKREENVVLIADSYHANRVGELRAFVHHLIRNGVVTPVVMALSYAETSEEALQIKSSADIGAPILDGLCDGILLYNSIADVIPPMRTDVMAFGILQAGRVRTSKTEFISCPGCGRTLYNLEETIARVKAATSHLTGLKIGIMGCIVNGPGEMADADYGYVGAGRGRINLYKKKECIEKGIPEAEAVDKLIELIKRYGDYVEKKD